MVGLAAPDRQHQVGGDNGDADRHESLSEIVSDQPLEDEDLQQRASRGDGERARGDAEEPVSAPGRDVVANVGAEQEQRAVRKIDVAHQAENESEATRNEEIQARERDAVQDSADKRLLSAEQPVEPVRPDAPEDHPQEQGAGQETGADPDLPGCWALPGGWDC